MSRSGPSLTARVTLALVATLVVTFSAVMAAPHHPGTAQRPADDPTPKARSIGIDGWIIGVTPIDGGVVRARVVTDDNGTFEVDVDGQTKLVRLIDSHSQDMARDDLTAGMPVDVQGTITSEARIHAVTSMSVGQLRATTPAESLTVRGRVVATFTASATTGQRNLVVVTTTRGEGVVEVTKDTAIATSEGKPLTFGDLHAGLAVQISARGTTQAIALAERIEVSERGLAPQISIDGLLVAQVALRTGGERWIVGEVVVLIPADLKIDNGAFAVGAQVSITARRNADGELEALKVRTVSRPTNAQPVELRGRIDAVNADGITVDGTDVGIDASTAHADGLQMGLFVKVTAVIDPTDSHLRATTIVILTPGRVEVQFEGPINAITGTQWTVASTLVRVGTGTKLTGLPPAVGLHAEVAGVQVTKGVVEATSINVEGSLTPTAGPVEGQITLWDTPPAIWRIVDRNKIETEVIVAADTPIDDSLGGAQVGAWVTVHGQRNGDNRVEAKSIRVRGNRGP